MDPEKKTLAIALGAVLLLAFVAIPIAGRLGQGAGSDAVQQSLRRAASNLGIQSVEVDPTGTVSAVSAEVVTETVSAILMENVGARPFTGIVSRVAFRGDAALVDLSGAECLTEILCDGMSKTPADLVAAIQFAENVSDERDHPVELEPVCPTPYDPATRTLSVTIEASMFRGRNLQDFSASMRHQALVDLGAIIRYNLQPVVRAEGEVPASNEVCIVFCDEYGNRLSFPWPDLSGSRQTVVDYWPAPLRKDPPGLEALTGGVERVVIRDIGFPISEFGLDGVMALKLCDGKPKSVADVHDVIAETDLKLARRGLLLAQVYLDPVAPFDAATKTLAFRIAPAQLGRIGYRVVDGSGRSYRTDSVARCLGLLGREPVFDYFAVRSVLRFLERSPVPLRR